MDSATVISRVADSAPLGLAAFALTTFLLSAANAGWMTKASGAAFLGYAFFYGGLVQLLAGMWEFRKKNVFGATPFSPYGGFWLRLGLLAPFPVTQPLAASVFHHHLGSVLLPLPIFQPPMLRCS